MFFFYRNVCSSNFSKDFFSSKVLTSPNGIFVPGFFVYREYFFKQVGLQYSIWLILPVHKGGSCHWKSYPMTSFRMDSLIILKFPNMFYSWIPPNIRYVGVENIPVQIDSETFTCLLYRYLIIPILMSI